MASPAMDPKSYSVGHKVTVFLRPSQTKVEGVVFAVDHDGRRIILEEYIPQGKPGLRNTRVINLVSVESAVFDSEVVEMEPLPAITTEQALKREKASFRAKEEALITAGPVQDITDPRSKMLFDTLSKMYECRWDSRDKKINIPDLDVTVRLPYRSPADVAGKDRKAVKNIVDMIAKMGFPK